jgi:hypothetical protein
LPYGRARDLRRDNVASNTKAELEEKAALYFEAGAKEVWICDLLGHMEFFGAPASRMVSSTICPSFPVRIGRSD